MTRASRRRAPASTGFARALTSMPGSLPKGIGNPPQASFSTHHALWLPADGRPPTSRSRRARSECQAAEILIADSALTWLTCGRTFPAPRKCRFGAGRMDSARLAATMVLICGRRRGPERVPGHVRETLAARASLAVGCEAAGDPGRAILLCQADGMRKYVIMGIQGSGKGTQAKMLAADLDLVHISVGDIFRWNVQNHTKMGAQVRRVMAAGELVGDDLVESVVRDRLTQHDWNFGFIIDGFPRDPRQAEFFLESYDIDGVIELDLPDSEVRRRVLNRRLCADCGMDYNLIANSPKVPGQCDMCGGELITREDDTEEALAVRLRDYHDQTNPVLEIFRRKEYVYTVDARPAPEVIQQQIRQCLGLPPYQPENRGSEVA